MGAAHIRIMAVNQDELREEFRAQVAVALEQTSRDHQFNCGLEGEQLREEIREQIETTLQQTVVNVSTANQLQCGANLEEGITAILDLIAVGNREHQAAVSMAVEAAVTQAVEMTVTQAVETAIDTAVQAAVENATKPIKQLLQTLVNDIALLRNSCGHTQAPTCTTDDPTTENPTIDDPPQDPTPTLPTSSCSEILAAVPSSPSGYYWLRAGNGSSIRVYCDMTRTCGGITGGWMQVANIDMTDRSHTCPQGLRTMTMESKRLCTSTDREGCSSATIDAHGINHTHVCGKITGYQNAGASSFYQYYLDSALTIDDHYVDGVILTHGANPRTHVWTFAAGLDEIGTYVGRCPCLNPASYTQAYVPPWVGNDYFCDTGSATPIQAVFFSDDPLWDGEGCGPTSTCCSFNNPPWFSKQLPLPTTDDIEMRVCNRVETPYYDSYYNILVESIAVYIQ